MTANGDGSHIDLSPGYTTPPYIGHDPWANCPTDPDKAFKLDAPGGGLGVRHVVSVYAAVIVGALAGIIIWVALTVAPLCQ